MEFLAYYGVLRSKLAASYTATGNGELARTKYYSIELAWYVTNRVFSSGVCLHPLQLHVIVAVRLSEMGSVVPS